MHGIKIAICALFLLNVACDQTSQTKAQSIVLGAGPRGVDMNTALAVMVNPPVNFRCSFQGPGKRAFVIYHLVANQWTPMMSCNNGSGSDIVGRLTADEQDSRRLITGWYELGQGWQQCDIRGLKSDEHAEYLSCRTPDGWSSTFACAKGQCASP